MIQNSNKDLYAVRGTSVVRWGKDQTGTVTYNINNQGFRSDRDYDWPPHYAFFGSSSIFGIGVNYTDLLVNQFDDAQNYGLAGKYLNKESLENLKNFVATPLYYNNTQIVFFWIDRPGQEYIDQLIPEANDLCDNILHISQGVKYTGAVNLMPHIDLDVSGTQPGVKTHKLWANTIKQCLKK
jgi:hypothetical protein